MNIREATAGDFDSIWPIFQPIAAAGETYAYPRDTSREQAFKIWMEIPGKTYVVEENDQILGTYYIKTNQQGPGDHVCNCGYMVSTSARGRGLATACVNTPSRWQENSATRRSSSILSPQAMRQR